MFNVGISILLFLILIYASYSDIKTHNVPDPVHWVVLLLAAVKVIYILSTGSSLLLLLNMALGMMCGFALMYLQTFFGKGKLGGADIKLMAVCGLLIGLKSDFGGNVCRSGSRSYNTYHCFKEDIRHQSVKSNFPLVPYLSAGVMFAYYFGDKIMHFVL